MRILESPFGRGAREQRLPPLQFSCVVALLSPPAAADSCSDDDAAGGCCRRRRLTGQGCRKREPRPQTPGGGVGATSAACSPGTDSEG